MTLRELETTDRDFLKATDVARFIGCDPQIIRVIARNHPEKLGFPVCVMQTRVRIPRLAFLKWLRGELGGGEQ